MEWLSAENVVAVGTAALGVLTSVGVLWYERRVPRRRRIGYRVQLDTPIGRDGHDGGANVRLGWFAEAPGMEDATLVLLRIENDGSQSIDESDYTRREVHGLEAVFAERTIRGAVVSVPRTSRHLMGHFTEAAGFGYNGATLCIPRVPLNRGEHYKLLCVLSGGGVGRAVNIEGGIKEGDVKVNRSTTPDDKPPLFSRAARVITVLLTVCVVVLAGIIVARDDSRPPMGCAKGELRIMGSTAFAPVLEELADKYEKDCATAHPTVTVDTHGSMEGIRALADAGADAKGGSPAIITLSDGPKPSGYPQLRESRIAVSVFALVLNDDVPLKNLKVSDVRRIYRGEIRNWKQLGGPDLPVRLVSRDANSGTRQVFQRRVLKAGELANTSLDCVKKDTPDAPVARCELDNTDQVLETVAKVPGAIGYSELRAATSLKGLHRLKLDNREPSLDALEHGDRDGYPYREIEYAYTYGQPPADSLASSFLTYMSRGSGQDVIRTHGHLPCATPEGLRICGEE